MILIHNVMKSYLHVQDEKKDSTPPCEVSCPDLPHTNQEDGHETHKLEVYIIWLFYVILHFMGVPAQWDFCSKCV